MKLKSLLLLAASIPTMAFAQNNYQTQYLTGTYLDQAEQYDIISGNPSETKEGLENQIGDRLLYKKEEVENRKGVRILEKKVEVEARKDQVANNQDKMTTPMPDATMSSPTPPVSSSVNSQMPVSYPGQSAVPQQSIGIPPPTVRAEMSGQVGQSAIPQPDVGMPPPTIRAEMPGQAVPSMSRPEPQVLKTNPVNLGPGPINPSVAR